MYGVQTCDELCAESEQLKSLILLATSLYAKGDYVGSQEACLKLNELRPNNLKILCWLSATYSIQKNFDKAIEILNNVPENFRECAEVLDNLEANCMLKIKDARDANNLAVLQNQTFIESFLGYIKTLIKIENFEKAIEIQSEIINLWPNLPRAYILHGRLMNKLKRFTGARRSFQKALQLDPESKASWIGYGDSLAFDNKNNGAVVCYEKALSLDKSWITPYIKIGYLYYGIKQFKEAAIFLNQAIQINPLQINILPKLADAYLQSKNFESAIKTYSSILKVQPNIPDVLYEMGLIHFKHLHNAADAENKLCVELDKKNISYNKYPTAAYLAQNKEELALKSALKCAGIFENNYEIGVWEFYKVAGLFPRNRYSYWKSGLMFYEMSCDDNALSRFEEARKLRQNFFLPFFYIALIYVKQNRQDDAEEFFRKALQLNPRHYDTFLRRIALRQGRGSN